MHKMQRVVADTRHAGMEAGMTVAAAPGCRLRRLPL